MRANSYTTNYKGLLSEELDCILFFFVVIQNDPSWPNTEFQVRDRSALCDFQVSRVGYIFFEHISMSQEQHLLAELFSEIKCRSGTARGFTDHNTAMRYF